VLASTCLGLAVPAYSQSVTAPQPVVPDNSAIYLANEPGRALKEGKVARAFRIRGAAPAIDGRLNDEVWTFAETISGFIQRDPDNGESMTEATRIQVAYDDRFVYVAVHLGASGPDAIAAGLGRRDEFPSTDYFGLGFDARHDHLTAYQFETNPSGVQRDFFINDDDRFDFDYSSVWEVRTAIGTDGWSAEFRIPFSQLRFTSSPLPGQVWGFNARRYIRRNGELGTWVPKPRGERGEVSLFGHLVFDDPIAAPRRIEVMPYVAARGEQLAGRADGAVGTSAGADLRVGLGTAATLSATVNPDFGQVEQDPAVLNLSVFETFFPEKRAFFLEDSRTFVPPYGLFQLFHSRRIGRTPNRFPLESGDELVERPDETTILGAAKITGKTGRWTYGTLTALTAREHAQVVAAGSAAAERLVEPYTSYNVGRIQRDVLGGSSNIGALVTGVFRAQSDDAFTGGMDYNLRWDQNRLVWNGHWVATRAPGAGGLRTSGGGVTNLSYARKYWDAWSHFDHFGRDFRVNDIGFFRNRTNRNQVDGGISANRPDPYGPFRSVGSNFGGGQAWSGDDVVFGKWVFGNHYATLRNFWNVNGGWTRNFETLDDIDTRGGPPILDPASWFGYLNVNSDSRKSWRVNFHWDGSRNDGGGRNRNLNVNITLQPTAALQLSLSSGYTRGIDAAQWLSNRDADGDGVTDHVYGTLRRDVVDITMRGTYAINRDLTFQAYLQPFVAVGDYDDIRKLARARSFEFSPVTLPSNPDFNTKSLRGNMVLRWEYLRGSTLFFVWDLSQSDSSRPGSFSALRDLSDAFGADANHVIMLKVSYWLNR
jgi:hypothetical protein